MAGILFPLLLPVAGFAQTGATVLQLPPVQAKVDVGGTPVAITAWGEVSVVPEGTVRAELTADLRDLQTNMTTLLQSELNRSDRCGERLSVERATLAPASPAAVLTANVHYERWGCAKVFGKEVVKRLLGGNGVIEARLTVSTGAEGVSLASEVQKIQADGSLGEALQAGSLGAALREKIARSIESAIRKGVNWQTILPAPLNRSVTIRSAEFRDDGAGQLRLFLRADAQLSPEQLRFLTKQ